MPERLDTLTSYLPRRLIERLDLRGRLPSAPTADWFEGAALFADLSGFTPLAERLAREGAEGAERLTRILENCFSDIIARVLGSGGDVMTFAGDAVLAVWPASAACPLDAAARAAVRCAEDCHEALRLNAINADGALRLRIGVGVGECTLHELGGVDGRWTVVVSGPSLRCMGRAEKLANPGETVISDEVQPLLGAATALERVSGGWRVVAGRRRLPPTPAAPAPLVLSRAAEGFDVLLRAFVPHAVQVRLDAGQTAWLAELRTVSAVFVQLHHLDPAQTEAGALLQQVVTAIQVCLKRWEGSLNKLVVDDRGTTIVIGFGFPPHAH